MLIHPHGHRKISARRDPHPQGLVQPGLRSSQTARAAAASGHAPAHRADDANRTINVLDLAEMIAQRWGVHHLEMQHTHFPSTETGYLEEFRNRLKKAKTQMNQINLEFGPLNISSPDPVLRVESEY